MNRRILLASLLAMTFTAAWASSALAAEPPKVRFKKTQLDARFRSEGVAVGDYNKDGKPDIAAGYVWYEAPDWKMHSILPQPPVYDPKGYSNAFCTFADDLNKDGWVDLIVVDFPGTPTWWFENPKGGDEPWKKHTCIEVTNNESPTYLDVDGDGKRELVCGFSPDPKNSDGPDRQMCLARPDADPYKPWIITPISGKGAPGTQRYSHGLGVGDVNKDGRNDIICANGWWESPADKTQAEWKFNAANFGSGAAQMFAYDFDGDGDNDVLGTSPHAFGMWWYEQLPEGKWQTHEIDKSVSQTHGVCLADINGDGVMDFVTGKRFWAHASGDPGVDDPALFCWFELTRKEGKPIWTRHQFDHDSGPGTQFEIADVNGDKLPDIIASNKKGVHYFEQIRE